MGTFSRYVRWERTRGCAAICVSMREKRCARAHCMWVLRGACASECTRVCVRTCARACAGHARLTKIDRAAFSLADETQESSMLWQASSACALESALELHGVLGCFSFLRLQPSQLSLFQHKEMWLCVNETLLGELFWRFCVGGAWCHTNLSCFWVHIM